MRDLSLYELQLKRISKKLQELKNLDKDFKIFGAIVHKYKLSTPIPIEEIERIEKEYNINLPNEYVAFITTLGDGGASPCYGLSDVESAIKHAISCHFDINKETMLEANEPLKDFLIKCIEDSNDESDEMDEKENYHRFEDIYNGTISIADGGCSVDIRLIINGCNSGKTIKVCWDGFDAFDGSFNPEETLNSYFESELNVDKVLINFLDWYEKWLDKGIEACKQRYVDGKVKHTILID